MNASSTALDLPAPAIVAAPGAAGLRPRLDSVDLLRGVVMIVMALDHTRDYFTDARFDPTDLTQTSAALFLTRWITHFCAPVFMLLAGTSAYLSLGRGRSKAELSRFLVTRGLWLILLEVTVLKLGWENYQFDPHSAGLMVIWALGWSMLALAALIHLPPPALVAFGLVLVGGHNLLDAVRPQAFGAFAPLWQILHVPGSLFGAYDPNRFNVFVAYPLVPWIGVMALGFALGRLLEAEPAQRRRTLVRLGLGLIALFVVLRAGNLYGDAQPWSVQAAPLFTLFSFVNTTKYPPSLLYLSMTLGPALLALAAFEHWRGRSADFVRVFGRVPMFYYVLHIFLLSSLAAIAWRAVFGVAFFVWDERITTGGWSLPVVYAIWLGVVLALYLPCRWFAALKARRREAWLSYL